MADPDGAQIIRRARELQRAGLGWSKALAKAADEAKAAPGADQSPQMPQAGEERGETR
jgi:hypothetical protein